MLVFPRPIQAFYYPTNIMVRFISLINEYKKAVKEHMQK